MLSAESQVDVILGPWKNVDLTKIELSSSVRFLGSYPVRKCDSARGQKDTFDGSAYGKSPCEVGINEGRVESRAEGRAEGRIGVHVEREVVFKSEGNNNDGSCDMLC